MSGGHKQPPVVKQTGEVGLFSLPRRLSAIDNPARRAVPRRLTLTWWVIHVNRKHTSRSLEEGKPSCWNHKWLTEEPGGSSEREVSEGAARAVGSEKHLLLPASWLRPRGQPGHGAHTKRRWLRLRVGVQSDCAGLQIAAVIYRLFLTRLQPA